MAVLTKITSRSLADNAVTAAHVQVDALGATDIAANAITASELADGAVDTDAIANDAITSAKIGTDAVVADGIAASAVGISELHDNTGVTSTHFKIPVYANDAARNSAISSPTNGMMVYNTTSNAMQQYNGAWSTIAPAPSITALSGLLNDDNDSTITVFGTNFTSASSVKMFTAVSGGSQIGSNATVTFVSTTVLKAIFGVGSIGASGSVAYIEVDSAGSTNRFATALTVNADPTVTHAGATGTNADTTDHLGTYGGASAGGGDDPNTKLLLNFDRGGFTDIEDSSNTGGDGHKVIASADAKIKSSPFGDGRSAIKFDGTGDRLAVPDHADFDFGAGDWTVEAWIWIADHGENTIYAQFENAGGNTNQRAIWFRTKTNGFLHVQLSGNGTGQTWGEDTTNAVRIGEWTHVALVKSNSSGTTGNITPYINGKQGTGWVTNAYGFDMFDSTSTPTIGSTLYDATQDFNGYMDEIRISKGIARYTSTFSPPTTRFTSDSYTSWLVHSNLAGGGSSFSGGATAWNAFADSSADARTITPAGTPFHSTLYNGTENSVFLPAMTFPASGKTFGSYGAYFDGTGDYLTVDHNTHFDLSNSNSWTVEFWIYLVAFSQNDGVFAKTHASSYTGWDIRFGNPSNYLGLCNNNNGQHIVDVQTVLSTGQWYHVAFTCDTTNLRCYLGGVLVHTVAASNFAPSHSANPLYIGKFQNFSNREPNMYLDLVRFSTSVRWTANFTPPTTLYGAASTQTLPTITLTGATSVALAADEDIEFTSVVNPTKPATTQHLTDSGIGLVLTNLTGGNKNKATLTGTIAGAAGTTHSNMAVKAQVRKSLGDAAYNNSTTVTFSGSTVTTGLAPGMPLTGTGISAAGPLVCGLTNASTTVTAVSTTGLVVGMQVNAFTGVPVGATIASIITNTSFVISSAATATDADAKLTFNTIIASVDSTTVITLSNTTTNGNQTGNTLIFEDLARVAHVNGAEVLAGGDAMMTIATGTSGEPTLFNARRFMGHTVARDVTGFGFEPDLVWHKNRGATDSHYITDTLVGRSTGVLNTNNNGAQWNAANYFMGMLSDGYSIGTSNSLNRDNVPLIGWGWKAGGTPYITNVGGITPTSGSRKIDGVVSTANYATSNIYPLKQSLNTVGGFSISNYNGSGSQASVPHGLSATPDFVIVKAVNSTGNWVVWHQNLTSGYAIWIDVTTAQGATAHRHYATGNDHVTLHNGDANINSASFNYIMYAWTAVSGVSAFGSYTVSGTTGGPKVTLDFRPKFIMVKNINQNSSYCSWTIIDAFRSTGWGTSGTAAIAAGAATLPPIYANDGKVEGQRAGDTSNSVVAVTIFDDGFQFTNDNHKETASDAGVYIYCAFA